MAGKSLVIEFSLLILCYYECYVNGCQAKALKIAHIIEYFSCHLFGIQFLETGNQKKIARLRHT
jgi:hypothetical protein